MSAPLTGSVPDHWSGLSEKLDLACVAGSKGREPPQGQPAPSVAKRCPRVNLGFPTLQGVGDKQVDQQADGWVGRVRQEALRVLPVSFPR